VERWTTSAKNESSLSKKFATSQRVAGLLIVMMGSRDGVGSWHAIEIFIVASSKFLPRLPRKLRSCVVSIFVPLDKVGP
jgi:hypothetical protein